MGGVSAAVLFARAYLSRVGEPDDVAIWQFVRRVGPEQAAADIRAGTAPADALSATEARRHTADPEADLLAAQRHGVRLIVPESDDWPHFALAALERTGTARIEAVRRTAGGQRQPGGEPIPPLALWVRGPLDPASLAIRSAGIVGARAATEYGLHVTAELAFGLASSGVTVVSGGAYGIDAAAHRGALAADAETVAVSAGGLDRAYPAGNGALFERIAATGLLMSEHPPGRAPQRHRFLSRNRLIAAFSTGVVVVEAAGRSGAHNTATHARVLGRPVMAVPGPVTSALSVGTHELIRRGTALLVTGAEDVLAEVGPVGSGRQPDERVPSAPVADVRAELDTLDETARRVFEGLAPRRYASVEALASRTGMNPLAVVRALPALELAGLLEVGDAGYRLAARVTHPSATGAGAAS